MRDHLIIHVNRQRHEIRGGRAFQSLSNFLRYDLCLTGTKVVCAEGDCGSCAVLIDRGDGKLKAVTSCIQFLYQLDGASVVTIEGLKDEGGKLNAVQESMVRCQGAQCGFCTPGFVVAMCGMLQEQPKLDEHAVRAGLSGNLCRCTGYEPIITAGIKLASPVARVWNPCEKVSDPVLIESEGRTFFKPTAIAQAVEFKSAHPDCAIVAGGTDLGVQINKGIRDPKTIMYVGAIEELREIKLDGRALIVGANATLTDLERATERLVPEFGRMMWRHGSPLIRNAGTLAGNVANGSPIGDTMPALYVLNGEIELTGRAGARRVNINDFYTGYRKTCMAADEIITRVFMPLPDASDEFRLYKVSKRHDLDISTFTAAFWMRLSGDGVISNLRIAYGGCGPNIIRLRKTEAALTGKPFNEAEIEAVTELARSEITPISDVRGSADYRLLLAENILRKFYAEVTGEQTYSRATTPSRVIATQAATTSGNGNGEPH